jgi:hypothetical protein
MAIIEIRPLGSSSSSSSIGRAFQVSELRRQCKPLKRFKHVAVRALVETNSNGSFRRSRKQTKEVIMVDPLEAKRLAAEEWKLLQARAALQVFFITSMGLLSTYAYFCSCISLQVN